MKTSIILLTIACCLLTGCASSWTTSRGDLLDKKSRYGVEITTPAGWYTKKLSKTVFFTHHGLSIEYIKLESRSWEDTLVNGYPIPKHVLLHEIPELLLGELFQNWNAYNLVISSNEITTIDNVPCSMTKYEYTLPNGMNMKGVLYCIPFMKSLTILQYAAEKSVYFSKSYNEFAAVVSSIDISKNKYLLLPGLTMDQFTIESTAK